MFDGPHLHLALNHFPVIGYSLVLVLGLFAWVLKKSTLKLSVFYGSLLISILAYPAFETGELADEKIEKLRPSSEQFIEDHEEAAEKVIWLAGLSGLLGLSGIVIHSRKKIISNFIFFAIIASLFLSSIGFVWVANLGGQISHPEIRKNTDNLLRSKIFEDKETGNHEAD